MKAMIRPHNHLNAKQRRAIEEFVEDRVIERINEESVAMSRRFFKIAFITLNEQFGFGAKRLCDFMGTATRVMEEWDGDQEYWVAVDQRLKQIGITSLPDEDYEDMARRWQRDKKRA